MSRPHWILNRAALAAHRRQLAEHGGAPTVHLACLCIALGWPKTIMALSGSKVSVFDLAAGYAEGVLRVRPFGGANERMAFLLAMLFLTLNGVHLPATPAEQLAMFRAFEMGAIDRTKYAQWMLMRTVAQKGGTVVGVRRDAGGRVVGVGLLRAGAGASAVRRRMLALGRDRAAVPLLQN